MKAVIFDLDDTLFDHTRSITLGVFQWLEELQVVATDNHIAEWFAIEKVNFNSWLAGEVSHQEQRRNRLRSFLPYLGLPVPEDLDSAYDVFLRCYEQQWAAFDDAEPALSFAKGNDLRIGVLTNGTTLQQNAKLAAIGLADHVEVVCTSESLGAGKPAPEAYLSTCTALGVAPADACMIGDNLELDVIAARRAGLSAVHLDRAAGDTLTDLVRRIR
ncbi:HAD family hydrolase [Kribbella sp. NBC_01245]|uniref:HAD family hydrolase n=1 Tax=Kribbella sp. NBC_01245 TaxID=2903578 RepID=UPI002E2853DA|nr:HAD family hydrolase [Kribbella sp. NBC_01245]